MQPVSSPPPTGFDPARLILEHQAGVWRYLRALGCEAALAEDLTQETFLIVLQKPFQDMGPAATVGFLRKIAHNLLISHHRRHGRMKTLEHLEEIAEAWNRLTEKSHQGEALLESLGDCMQHLTPRARRSLELRFREQRSREEIAADLEITPDGAKNLMQRAKQQLRECLERKAE